MDIQKNKYSLSLDDLSMACIGVKWIYNGYIHHIKESSRSKKSTAFQLMTHYDLNYGCTIDKDNGDLMKKRT